MVECDPLVMAEAVETARERERGERLVRRSQGGDVVLDEICGEQVPDGSLLVG